MDKNKVIESAAKLVAKGQLDKAAKEFQRALDEDPDDVRILQKLAELYQKMGKKEQAADCFEKVAKTYSAQGFYLKAVALYKQVLKVVERIEVNIRLAEMYQQLGLIGDATKEWQAVATHYEKIGDLKASLDTLKKLVDLDPDNWSARCRLGEQYARQENLVEAVSEFRRAAAYLQKNARQDDYLRVAERISHFDQGDATLARELAEIYLGRGDAKRALAKLQICFKANPRDLQTLQMLARAFQSLGQVSKTVSVLKELGRVHLDGGRPEEARSTYQQAAELAPDDPDIQSALEQLQAEPKTGRRSAPGARPASSPGLKRSSPGRPVPRSSPGLKVPPPAAARPPTAPIPAPTRPVSRPGIPVPPPRAMPPPPPPMSSPGISVPPPPPPAPQATMSSIPKLLKETEVYVKYGLHEKALDHLGRVFALEPDNTEALEKSKTLALAMKRPDDAKEALAKLVHLYSARSDPRADAAKVELRELDPAHPALRLPAKLGAAFSDAELEATAVDPPREAAPRAASGSSPGVPAPGSRSSSGGAAQSSAALAPPPPDAGSVDARGSNLDADGLEAADISGEHAMPVEVGFSEEAMARAPAAEGAPAALVPPAPQVAPAPLVPPPPAASGSSPGLRPPPSARGSSGSSPGAGAQPDATAEFASLSDFQPAARAAPPSAPAAEPAPEPPVASSDDTTDEALDMAASSLDDEAQVDPSADLFDPAAMTGPHEATEGEDHFASDLAEADFYIDAGLFDDATAILEGILLAAPDHPGALSRLAELDQRAPPEPGSAAGNFADQAHPAAADADALAAELAAELASEVADFALTDMDQGPLDREQPDGPLPVPAEPAGSPGAQMQEAVRREDAQTHYDLGIAYKEMGLLDEAIAEFQLALQFGGGVRKIDCITILGVCAIEKGRPEEAVQVLSRALAEPGLAPDAQRALSYELGQAYEALGERTLALAQYHAVARSERGFRDTTARIQRLGGTISGPVQPTSSKAAPVAAGSNSARAPSAPIKTPPPPPAAIAPPPPAPTPPPPPRASDPAQSSRAIIPPPPPADTPPPPAEPAEPPRASSSTTSEGVADSSQRRNRKIGFI